MLAKQIGVRPDGWESVVGDYSQEGYRSVADVVDAASLGKVRAFKKEKKAAAKGRVRRRCRVLNCLERVTQWACGS